jgi:hypothetical protein
MHGHYQGVQFLGRERIDTKTADGFVNFFFGHFINLLQTYRKATNKKKEPFILAPSSFLN